MDATALPEPTGSRRVPWTALPPYVPRRIEALLGRRIAGVADQSGGFSEGAAARVRLSDGSGVFVKAASASPAAAHHRQEIRVSRRLPAGAPVPRLLHTYDDGDWVALVFEEVPGRLPAQPWRRGELDRVLSTVTDLARVLTPWPQGDLATPRLTGWHALVDGAARARLRAFSPWAADRASELAAIEETPPGDTLLHGDLYPFNVMLTGESVYVVDWPHAWVGAAHCDVVTLLASLTGIDPEPIVARHPLTRDVEPARIDATLAAHSGFLLRGAVEAGPAADPRLVAMMAALGVSSLRWLRARLTGPGRRRR